MKRIFLFVIAMMLFCGCSGGREYLSETVDYSEDHLSYSFRVAAERTSTALAEYCFEVGIPRSERENCIKQTDLLLKELGQTGQRPEIYVFSEVRYDGVFAQEGRLYTSVRDWSSQEYLTDVILTVYGGFSHYGLAWGYADILGERLGLSTGGDTAQYLPETEELYDLNLLCFDESFASTEDILAVKRLSAEFARSVALKQGEEGLKGLLSGSDGEDGATAVAAELEAFFLTKDVEFSPSQVMYRQGGLSCDYIAKSGSVIFYIARDWQDAYFNENPLLSEAFLHEDYPATREFFEVNIYQMGQYRELFCTEVEEETLTVVFSNLRNMSFYEAAAHRIYLDSVDSLMHEYIHSLMRSAESSELWAVEGFARYFSFYFDLYGLARLNADYNSTEAEYVREFIGAVGRPIDVQTDFTALEHLGTKYYGFTDPNSGYLPGSSFVGFLVGEYGEEAVIRYLQGDVGALPKGYAELAEDWRLYIARYIYGSVERY